jgi:hypothetical protein
MRERLLAQFSLNTPLPNFRPEAAKEGSGAHAPRSTVRHQTV